MNLSALPTNWMPCHSHLPCETVLDEPITDAPSQYASEFGKECLQNAIYLGCKATESILTDVDRDAEHRMRVPISVHEDANARRSTTLLHDLPVARYN
jgi:hypothetical protein